MSLLEELKTKRTRAAITLGQSENRIDDIRKELDYAVKHRDDVQDNIADIDKAIAALSAVQVALECPSEPEIAPELPDGFTVWEGGACPFPLGATLEVLTRRCGVWPIDVKNEAPLLWEHEGHDLDIIAYRIISSSEADSGPRSEAIAGDERIEQTISTLQASSGEGETTVSELGAADVDGVDAQTAGATLPDGGQESPDLLQESRCSVAGCEIHGTPPIDATEPAAYSPVNNADEPVTKPEADFFAQALIPVQPGIEFSVDGGPKQATGAAKLFGGLGIFGKPKALVGEGA